ncbi:FAD-dependent oxidoreductase [Actinomadura rupiterrae]|uniref:FAD-dependent oxidoreductase n=1 Tax=Actinomadura rupiterrae TaxID=559627 RepID=UPI0020A42C2E|nr:FAD-dependent oxidoreductase [Actinomadura rupiterrae]MCP2341713.1 glycine/D-amino acid oxidase-like deaminating enzyme [Actinomadura rupiterrae]
MSRPRIAIVGAGIAGALLALRLREQWNPPDVDLFTAWPPTHPDTGGRSVGWADASRASGGMVRAFETDPGTARLAAESLAELRGSPELRERVRFREHAAVYVAQPGSDLAASLAVVDEVLPGAAEATDADRIAREYGFHGLPRGAPGVVERQAGHLSPDALRAAALTDFADLGGLVRAGPVTRVEDGPSLKLADGTAHGFDLVVVAAGAWTERLLADSGLPGGGFRTRQIQYTLCRTARDAIPSFVDEHSGLYGRPDGPGRLLLGLPTVRWDVDPDAVVPDRALAARVVADAAQFLAAPVEAERTVASFDCFRVPPGLELRPVAEGVVTFTGGSGGAAKTALAASRVAGAVLAR